MFVDPAQGGRKARDSLLEPISSSGSWLSFLLSSFYSSSGFVLLCFVLPRIPHSENYCHRKPTAQHIYSPSRLFATSPVWIVFILEAAQTSRSSAVFAATLVLVFDRTLGSSEVRVSTDFGIASGFFYVAPRFLVFLLYIWVCFKQLYQSSETSKHPNVQVFKQTPHYLPYLG